MIGTFGLNGIRSAPRGVPKIEVSFDLDANGILNVTAEDKESGRNEKISIVQEKGRLSSREIDQMVREAERYRADDQRYEEKVKAKNRLEQAAYDVRNRLNEDENASKLSSSERETLEKVFIICLSLLYRPLIHFMCGL
jgi:heat shock protein 1/8